MSRVLRMLATAGAIGIFGYFVYTVILPKLKDIPLPSLPVPQMPQPIYYQQPAVQPVSYAPETFEPPPTKSTRTTTPAQPAAEVQLPAGGGGGTAVEGGIQLVYKTTGKKVSLPSKASPHENGDRYSAQHKFINYIIIAYLKGNQNAQGCKMDGPNHGKCQSKKPDCLWIDPDLQMSDGSIKYGAEYPHPKSNSVPCPSCKKAGVSLGNKWYGYQGIAYQGSGGPSDRWNEVWVDIGAGPNGEPGNKWVNLLKENYTKNIPSDWQRPNGLPVNCSDCGSGTGLEAEIRMRNGSNTSIKYGAIYEIVSPSGGGGTTPLQTQTEYQRLYPYMYNSFYNRRRL